MSNLKQVVLIMTDTQRKDMIGCYGNNDMKTPNLDEMANNGVRFENAYTTQPLCGPARSAIFTGTFPHSNGCFANSIPLGKNIKTIGERLSDKGIKCGYIGKWHLDGSDYFGLGKSPEGFDKDTWYDMRNYLEELDPEERILSRKTSSIDKINIPEEFTFAHRCSSRAVKFIEQHKNENFFLTVSYDEPHDPFLAPKKYSDIYKDYNFPKSPNIKDTLKNKPQLQKMWAGNMLNKNSNDIDMNFKYFLGCNTFVDYEIGRVLDKIKNTINNALVIYTSDHGDMLNSHHLTSKGPAIYEEITNIPLIIKWPKKVKPGSINKTLISHINITPTIIDYFGFTKSKILEGDSALPTLLNPSNIINDKIFIEYTRYEIDHDGFGGFQPLRCVYDGTYKLSINLLDKDELYDLENDPFEINNLIDDTNYENIKNKLHDDILLWMNQTRDPFRGYQWSNRPFRKNPPHISWDNFGMTRQREEDEIYEKRQLDYATGLEIKNAVRKK